MICIYCGAKNDAGFKGKEHVLPQSFGKFGSKTPTLDCVCDECNAYFAKQLDQVLARDTIEGITRYRKGLLSREQRFPKSIRYTLTEEADKAGEWAGALLTGPDPITGDPPKIRSQFWIRNIQRKKWERYPIEEIKNITITEEKYGSATLGNREMRILAPSQQEYDAVQEELKRYNILFRERKKLDLPPFVKDVDGSGKITVEGNIEGSISKIHKRALAKVLFNFATFYLGAEEIARPEWEKVRRFIRYDGDTLLTRISEKEFWTGQESKELRFLGDSYNLRIENKYDNVIGVIQLYNLFTYEFILIENYSLSPEKEVAYRFTPGREPLSGIKIFKREI